MSRSNLKNDWDDQIEQVMNETFKKLEALISSSSSQKKKKQCINNIVDIFEKILNSDASIKSQKNHSRNYQRSQKKHESYERTLWNKKYRIMKTTEYNIFTKCNK